MRSRSGVFLLPAQLLEQALGPQSRRSHGNVPDEMGVRPSRIHRRIRQVCDRAEKDFSAPTAVHTLLDCPKCDKLSQQSGATSSLKALPLVANTPVPEFQFPVNQDTSTIPPCASSARCCSGVNSGCLVSDRYTQDMVTQFPETAEC